MRVVGARIIKTGLATVSVTLHSLLTNLRHMNWRMDSLARLVGGSKRQD